MADDKQLFLERTDEDAAPQTDGFNTGEFSDAELLKFFKAFKKESFANRWLWERTWMRNIHYVNNRHWIEYVRRTNEWRDVRLAPWIPKPVTNVLSQGVQALRAMFSSVNIGVNVRPSGSDPKNVAVAAVADDMSPLLHEEHDMDSVLDESDFWFIVTGNTFIHTYLERDIKHGTTTIPFDQCADCQAVNSVPDIEDAGNVCPDCKSPNLQPAISPETGAPIEEQVPNGRGVSQALSPFELIFPNTYARFGDVPGVIRLRWRLKSFYENHPTLKHQVKDVKWSKAPAESSLQLFRSLPHHNDLGVGPFLGASSTSGENTDEEGAAEYELWMRPSDQFPQGLIVRVLGDANPIVLHLEEDEAIPGPLPYVDVAGKPLFPFTHAAFEQRGGRVYGTSPLDSVVQKQNLLNQLDSFVLMIVNRMSNPLWLVPKGAEIEKFTGAPGLVVKWNPLTVGGTAKPERVDGLGPNASLFQIREQHLKDIEDGLGTFDIIKGAKPPGVESFSGLQLLVERGQSRFSSAFKARGNLYKDWFKFAIEIEREFGPAERTRSILSPARTWTLQQFKNADLQGGFEVVVEDGSNAPKTALGTRAAVEHLNSLGFIDPNDPDQKYKVFQLFGQSGLSPALDIHMQAALRKQESFEQWANDPQAQQQSLMLAQQDLAEYEQQVATLQDTPVDGNAQVGPDGVPIPAPLPQIPPPPSINKRTPLAMKPWYLPEIHKQEFLKWANGDVVQELLQQNPKLEDLLTAHLQELDQAIQMALMLAAGPVAPNPGGGGIGGGEALANSNSESGGAQNATDHTRAP